MTRRIQIGGVVPAAGASRRMGTDKRLLPFRGQTVLEVTVGVLRAAGIWPIVVVLEPDSPCRSLEGLAGLCVVTNPMPERGMLSSIRTGFAALPEPVDAVAVLPGDHPFVPLSALQRLCDEVARRRPLLLIPRYAGRRGHPLFIDRVLLDEAAACDDAVGLRQLVHRRARDVWEVALELPGADLDLDEPADRTRLDEGS